MFVAWCESLAEPRASLPVSDATVALYLQAMTNVAKPAACAGEARTRRDRIIPEDKPLQSRADTIAGGLLGAELGDAALRFKCQEPQGAYRMESNRGLRSGVWSPTPRLLSPSGRDGDGRHVRRDVPLRRCVGPFVVEHPLRVGWERIEDYVRQAQERSVLPRQQGVGCFFSPCSGMPCAVVAGVVIFCRRIGGYARVPRDKWQIGRQEPARYGARPEEDHL
jgi:hypothetical protein